MDATMQAETSPLLRLPTELRLIIYEHLLLPFVSTNAAGEINTPKRGPRITASEYHEYEMGSNSNAFASGPRTLRIRTMDPTSLPPTRRTKYHIRSDRFRTRTTMTTYALQQNPGLHTAILQTCRQCHAEAAELLYSSYTFDFDTHVEAVIPFLADLTPIARASISSVALIKRALPYVKEFDRAEWHSACEYMATELTIPTLRLSLGVVAGKPGPNGWVDVPELTVDHFRLVQPRSAIAGVEFEWAEQLMWMRGLRAMHVRAIIEHCPPPESETMAFWVSFSKSIEGAFSDWIRGIMLA
ncbi:uncharacterized protein K452DRAFT_349406 [Aplosporella prunicola CBS 121167]|uniref:Uncharacterized protein n=1 Tax=Aplosporella prunicola CBS 121167 TaxID=1176127 RepID=A0A6A6BLW4_9PEZI|nr:uncharacterized protein K452DRAFT_349406 [Aplosporella prunicola CBS 121167]KAF2145099.1 hypothetical protein K452DRAFT_349406 [Aplosporella prunicola CBS 121167]